MNELTNAWGWGPEGFNPDRITDPPQRRGLVAAIEFVLDGPDDEVWHELREVAKRYITVARDGRGFIPVPEQDREPLAEICREFADYEANQQSDDGDERERERVALMKAAEYLASVIDGTFSHDPLLPSGTRHE